MINAAYNNSSFIDDDGKSNGKESYEKHRSIELSTKSANSFQSTGDYEPYDHRKVEIPLTNFDTIIHLFKMSLGTGIFAMPNAFKSSGYIVGFIGTIILGTIATSCVHTLVNLEYFLCKLKKVPSMNYPNTAEAALLAGPEPFHKYAKTMVHVINAFLLLYQIGSSCIYVVFMTTNIQAVLASFGYNIHIRLLAVIILVPLILLNWIRKLKYLTPLSTIGNFITIGSFLVIFYYIFREPFTLEGKKPYATVSEFPMFFCTVLFALEAIGVIMPLENEMRTPKDFRGSTGILNRAMFLIVALYIGLGLTGYLRYGDEIKPTITINLPQTDTLALLAKALIAVSVFATHALSCYVAIDIAWSEYILKRIEKSNRKLLWEYALRTGIVFITFVMAVAIPDLDLFISLIGALSLATLGILFPPFLETVAKWNRVSGFTKALMISKNLLFGVIGLAGFFIGSSISMKDIINRYLEES
ncbi:proton-coupled amino acid transporter-like protein CG1139 [Contarinia nasturtii]|uniref:proton-coupled amino acid transporter-like protein CG1139 n=1 Tax=Contarinia nasturtii TaxID=265458 RepID=UPI0012D416F9|nr:proton-coupled amino acid transporter-like protein CG1139 [Contarinia nasturtii]